MPILSLPGPYGGINSSDPRLQLPPQDAVWLENWWADHDRVRVRAPFVLIEDTTAETDGEIYSLLARSGADDSMIGVNKQGDVKRIYTDGTAIGELATGKNSSYWHGVVMNGVLGMCSEGADAPLTWNGTTLANMTLSGDPTATDLVGAHVYKSRSYFWDATEFYFSAVRTLGGALTDIALSADTDSKGIPMFMDSITLDSGAGPDDLAVFVYSDGTFLIFQGSNPGDANDWYQIGVFKMGRPVSQRCKVKLGGDLLVLTEYGIQSIITALQSGRVNAGYETLGRKLQGVLRASLGAARQYGLSSQQADMCYVPEENMLLVLLPVYWSELLDEAGSVTDIQALFAVNTITGAWSRFSATMFSKTMRTLLNYNPDTNTDKMNGLYIGDDDGVVGMGGGFGQDRGTTNDNILCVWQTPYVFLPNETGGKNVITGIRTLGLVAISSGLINTPANAWKISMDFASYTTIFTSTDLTTLNHNILMPAEGLGDRVSIRIESEGGWAIGSGRRYSPSDLLGLDIMYSPALSPV